MRNTISILLTISLVLACSTGSKMPLAKFIQSFDGQPVIPFTANKIFITTLTNQTGIPTIEQKITQRIIEKITINGRLAIAPAPAGSDITLSGSIQSFQVQPIVIDSARVIRKKRLLIIAIISLFNEHTKQYIFRNITVQAFKEFSDVDAPIIPFAIVQDEVEQALAARIALQVETGWYTSLKTEVEKGKK